MLKQFQRFEQLRMKNWDLYTSYCRLEKTAWCNISFVRCSETLLKIINRYHRVGTSQGHPNVNFRENICSEDDLRSRIFGAFVVKFLACLPPLGFSNI